MPGVPGSAVNEMIEMALRKRWLLQGGFRYMRYGLPQPVTSVTGFAMTGYKKCGGRWHTWVPPYKVFVGQGPCALPGEQGKNPPPFRQGRQQFFGGAVGDIGGDAKKWPIPGLEPG